MIGLTLPGRVYVADLTARLLACFQSVDAGSPVCDIDSNRRGRDIGLLFTRWPSKQRHKQASQERPQIAYRANPNEWLAHVARVRCTVHTTLIQASRGAGVRF